MYPFEWKPKVEIVFLTMNMLYFVIATAAVLVWLTWLMVYIQTQKSRKESLQLQAERLARFDTVHLPLKMQALERLVLLLERIRPESLVHRSTAEQAAASMQLGLLAQLRAEFEHNLAQQLYVNGSTWAKIVQARDLVAGAIQQAGAQIGVDVPAIQFARQLLQNGQSASVAIDHAITALRLEIESIRNA
jgi:hypothetical protein